MSTISVTVDGAARSIEADQKPTHIFAEAKEIVVCKVNGVLKDLWTDLVDGDVVEGVSISSPEGLAVLRHSTAHVMAQAVQQVFAQTRLGIGPPITDGFYYDFDPQNPFNPDDLEKIESAMRKIVKEGQRFRRRVTTEADALKELAHEPYKCELIGIKGGGTDETNVEVGGTELTIYDNLGRDGQPVWSDLCRGPHLPSTKHIPAFKLMRSAAAYWRGSEKNPMLQRIYGTAWPSQDELNAYLELLAEAEKRDHRRLGKQLDLFHFQEEAPGLIFWHPKGWSIWQEVEQYMRRVYQQEGYQEVKAPQILDRGLWEKSGHWENYKENMFTTESENRAYALKPMNCPGHVQIYNSGLHSYRELPLRFGEFGQCHRNEPSGALHGLMRVRGFTQDDGHIFCTEDQIQTEVAAFDKAVRAVYQDFGFTEVAVKLALRPTKRVGDDAIWDKAEEALRGALKASGQEWEELPGEGAFYGPKIEYHLKDSIGRTWQCGTIQVDFSMPARLGAEYVAEDNSRKTPVMLHRAIVGSLERFIGILIENHAGNMPVWLAPTQAVVLNISGNSAAYAQQVQQLLKKQGFRVESDLRNEKITYKIREHALQKIPFLLVVGDKESESNTVAVRARGGVDLGVMPLDAFVARLQQDISQKVGPEPS